MEKELIPKHIAIIMDGNGRWARKRGLPRTAGHAEGAKRVREVVENCARIGCEYLTLYALSTENLYKRPEEEVTALLLLFIKFVSSEKRKLIKNGIRVKIIGDIEAFSTEVRKAIDDLESYTSAGEKMIFYVALNYGGRNEIVRAARLCAIDALNGLPVDQIDENVFKNHLYTSDTPDPDLLIRTAGDYRLSNFLLFQLAYAEFYFTETYWPDFDKKCLLKAIEEYQNRNRRYGGI